ncbi:HemK2/MTQ2 family protein methyltransferase [Nocardia arizonensis]|uniref:HemK2/MTQ2 family protein methyltransferase n=1 Tax=Nocardia arizonensis TaxID=1141647 RepID=UPI0006D0CDCB|nr:HemK2/MTQ2 family protein methyltransferase [Nocardia arizonensis]
MNSGEEVRRLIRLPGVYRPQADTWLLARALRDAGLRPGGVGADLFTGTGALALALAEIGLARVTAVDLSRRAALSARMNCARAGVAARVHRGDFADVLRHTSFDVVTANPPYVPAPDGAVGGRGLAWDGGHDGRAVLDRLCALLPHLLRPRGVALIVHSALSGVEHTLEDLRSRGLKAAVVARDTVPFGPVMRRRADWLAAHGRIARDQRHEDLVVIRGDRIRW